MKDLVKLQQDLFHGLLSWAPLQNVNIVLLRKLRLENEVSQDTIWQTPRNGRSGAGLLVEMPTIENVSSNAPDPEDIVVISVAALEEPNLNFGPTTGTLLDAESIARLARTFMRRWFVRDTGEFYDRPRPIVPAEEFPNVIAYRASAAVRVTATPFTTLTVPTIAVDGSFVVTLTPAAGQEDAEIYYTLDDSLPGKGNSAALLYTGPFQTAVGDIVRWCSWKTGDYLPSLVDRATIAA